MMQSRFTTPGKPTEINPKSGNGSAMRVISVMTVSGVAGRGVGVVTKKLDMGCRCASFRPEHRRDRLLVAGIELVFAACSLDHRGPGETEPRAGQQRDPLGGAREH